MNLAYENVKEVDGLDVSKEGGEAWEAAMKRYDERIDRVETRITARLRDQLGTAKNANEMFRIFSRFNALFVRPHIRGAIREYQTQLIQRVKDDIEALHDKFKVCGILMNVCKVFCYWRNQFMEREYMLGAMEIIFGDWSIGIIMEVLLCKKKTTPPPKKNKKQKQTKTLLTLQ